MRSVFAVEKWQRIQVRELELFEADRFAASGTDADAAAPPANALVTADLLSIDPSVIGLIP